MTDTDRLSHVLRDVANWIDIDTGRTEDHDDLRAAADALDSMARKLMEISVAVNLADSYGGTMNEEALYTIRTILEEGDTDGQK